MVNSLQPGDKGGVEGRPRHLGGDVGGDVGGSTRLWSGPGRVLGSLHVISMTIPEALPLSKIRKLHLGEVE